MANMDNVGKNAAEKVGNTAQQASSAASNAAQKASANDANVTTQRTNTNKFKDGDEAGSSSSERSNDRKSQKQFVQDLYNSQGASAVNNEDLSPEEKKEFEKQRAAKNTADVINASADVAANSGNAYAKAFGHIHKGLNAATGGKYGDAVGKVASGVNRHSPGGKIAQEALNKFAESGAAEKVGDAISAKNGEAAKKAGEKAGQKAGEKAAEKAGEKAAENAASKTAKEAGKNAAKNAANSGSSKSVSDIDSEDSFFKKLFTNPLFWVLGITPVLLIAFLIAVVFMNDDLVKRYGTGEFPYVEMKYYQTIKVKDNGSYTYVDMDDYVAGVLAHEVACFSSSMDLLKAQAIVARTYAQYKMSIQGYILNSSNEQTYYSDSKYLESTSKFYQAAQATAGVVIVSGSEGNYKFRHTEYDALAVGDRCGGKIDTANNKYILCQKGVEVPIDWTKKHGLTGSWLDTVIKYYHGRGMSQWGAYYLAKEQGYDFKKILNLFYDNPQIVSLYPPAPAEGEGKMTLKPKVTPSDATQLVHKSVKSFLSEKGTSIKAVNDGLRDAVIAAGPGTREGVATAAIYLINTFASYNRRIPYQYGGGWSGSCSFDCRTNKYYGINPHWGSAVDSRSAKYNSLGMDCASFVTWAYHTGGLTYPSGSIKQFGYLSDEHVKYHGIKDTKEYVGQPGDFIHHPGHVMLIVGTYKSGGEVGYYIAEASGYEADVRIKKRTVSELYSSDSKNKVGEMTYHFEHNKVKNYKEAFDKGRLD